MESVLLAAGGLWFLAFCEEAAVPASILQCWFEKTSGNLQIGHGMNTLPKAMLKSILNSSILDVPKRPITRSSRIPQSFRRAAAYLQIFATKMSFFTITGKPAICSRQKTYTYTHRHVPSNTLLDV